MHILSAANTAAHTNGADYSSTSWKRLSGVCALPSDGILKRLAEIFKLLRSSLLLSPHEFTVQGGESAPSGSYRINAMLFNLLLVIKSFLMSKKYIFGFLVCCLPVRLIHWMLVFFFFPGPCENDSS